jgi:MFS family permease
MKLKLSKISHLAKLQYRKHRMKERPSLPRTVWVLGIVSLLMDLSSEIYHALLPAFLTVTLGLPVAAMGAIDGVAEATASMAKLVSGRLSDRNRRRKPWILLGYGLAALSKPLFPIAASALPVLGARFADRIGKGIRGAPRDAMIADETAPDMRGRAYGLRQSLDTVGAFLAPLAAIGLMAWFADDIRSVFWVATIPALLSFLVAWLALRESRHHVDINSKMKLGGFRDIDPATRRLILVGFIFTMARFSEGFLILRALDIGVSMTLSPLVLVAFNLAFGLFAYPAGALADRIGARGLLLAGMGVLIAADLLLAQPIGIVGLVAGCLLWGGHMALTQGLFAKLIADAAPAHLRATSFGAFYFASGIATLLASLGAGLIWDRSGASATFFTAAVIAGVAGGMLLLLPKRA